MPVPAIDVSDWDRTIHAFLAEKQRRSGSRRTVPSYSRLLRDCFGRTGKPPNRIFESARRSAQLVQTSHARYIEAGSQFVSSNDPATEIDETFDTFMTAPWVYLSHAETSSDGYRQPTERMMSLLQEFDAELEQSFAAGVDSPAADRFRARLNRYGDLLCVR